MAAEGLISEETYEKYLSKLLAGDRRGCWKIVVGLLEAGVGLLPLYDDLFKRSLYEVGDRWARHEVSVTAEHIASAITEHVMSLAYPCLFSHAKAERLAVVSCVAEENHQIGARMVADYFELQGWGSHFAGANEPLADLLRYVGERKPDVVALSVAVSANLPRLALVVEALLTRANPPRIIVGGQAFRKGGAEVFERTGQVKYLGTLSELGGYIKSYDDGGGVS